MFLELTPTQKTAPKGHKKPRRTGKVKKKPPNEVELKNKNRTVILKLKLIVYTGRS